MMNELHLTALSAFAGICLFIILFYVFFIKKHKIQLTQLQVQLNTNDIILVDLQRTCEQQEQQFSQLKNEYTEKQLENEQVTKQLEHRIKTLQENLQIQKDGLEALQTQQPEDKLYSRALKLVKLGADVEEVIRECDIPRAEAEMLLAVHNKK